MCRIFGFRSILQSQVHHSLVKADNNLGLQSVNHPDGWGVAYYVARSPHVIKSSSQALEDSLFKRVSGVVSSETVLAHIRKLTHGDVNLLNTHPFQYGRWVFAHNGNIKDFNKYRETFLNKIDPELKRFILGDTDSEIIFYLLLTNLKKLTPLDQKLSDSNHLVEAMKMALSEITQMTGPWSEDNDGDPNDTYLTFILTDGKNMIAHQGGKDLYYSTYKKRCSERDTCPKFSPVCEAPASEGVVNHMIFSSEPLSGENAWEPLKPGQLMGVDDKMHLIQIK